jgi:hypothetical protein
VNLRSTDMYITGSIKFKPYPLIGFSLIVQPLEPDQMHGLAWLGLALVARHRGVTKETALRNLVKS